MKTFSCWLVYLLGSVCVVLGNANSAAPKDKDWWEAGNFYQIYPRSFKDSNGDGIGDLKGVIEQLDYLQELGISGAWLSPIFKSPMVDFGYDTSDYYQIQDEYGTVEDFEELVAKAHDRDLKIILDFVPNHSSDEHDWFKKSIQRDPEYENYYVWHPGKIDNKTGERVPPNNWLSAFRYSAWEWNDQRQEYYLHQFAIQQPDLNYREPKLVQKMKDVLRYWLDKGVGGFRIDAVPYLYEILPDKDGNYPDEPLSGKCSDPEGQCYLNHIYTQDQNETFDMVYQWRQVLDDYTKEKGGFTRIIMTEAYTELNNIIRFFGNADREGSQIPFNFEMILNLKGNATAKQFKQAIDTWLNVLPDGKISNWVLGNHDNGRIASRFGVGRTDLLNILLQTLPGIAVTYNGEEIGMTDVYIPWNETVDPQACNTNPEVYTTVSRDPVRSPFQWNGSLNAGFSTAPKTWLPVSPDYKSNNVELQESASKSHLKVFKKLLQLRKGNVLQDGDFVEKLYNDDVYIYKREVNNEAYIIMLNFGTTSYKVDLNTVFPNINETLAIVLASVQSKYNEGDTVDSANFDLAGEIGVILTNIL